MPTRAECQAQVEAAVKKWADAFGLPSRYRWRVTFVREFEDDPNCVGEIDAKLHGGEMDIAFHECLKPEFYDLLAAHEVTHVLLGPLRHAVSKLTEPGQTLMDDHLHAAVYQIAVALSGTNPLHADKRGERPPWESS